jgi:DNA polymerase III epsilon subunit-like protein
MNFNQFIKESKFWGMSISNFLDYLEKVSTDNFIYIDTETTGLKNEEYEVQLTQISALVVDYNFFENKTTEKDFYNKKIKLTDKTKLLKKDSYKKIGKILSFNHYGSSGVEYIDEQQALIEFYNFLDRFKPSVWIIQNAPFDMYFLNTRQNKFKFRQPIIDTKDIAQLFYLPLLQTLAMSDEQYAKKIKEIGISSRDNGLISSSLSKIGPSLGINMSGYHDSLTDCRLTIQMFERMIDILKEHKNVDIRKYQQERINSIR